MFIGSNTKESSPDFIRGVALLPGETIDHVFSPELGLTQDLTAGGQLLVATNQRVVGFCRNEGRDETFLFPVAELQGVAVKGRSRNIASIVQGILLVAGGIFLYAAVAYWLTGRFDGPSVPLIINSPFRRTTPGSDGAHSACAFDVDIATINSVRKIQMNDFQMHFSMHFSMSSDLSLSLFISGGGVDWLL